MTIEPRRPGRLRCVVWACLLAVLWAFSARAQTVAVVRPDGAEPGLVETASRIHGELLAVGFQVQAIQRSAQSHTSDVELHAWLRELQLFEELDAAVELRADTDPISVVVWTFDGPSRSASARRVNVTPATKNVPERLAIVSIDALRSAFLERDMAQRDDPDPSRDERQASSSAAAPRLAGATDPGRLGLSPGVAVLAGLDGVGPAVMPLARLDWTSSQRLALQVTLAGLGSRPVLRSGTYAAELQQSYGVAGARYRVQITHGVQPFVALSLGVLATGVRGRAKEPGRARREYLSSVLIEGSVGADFALSERYYSTLAAHVHWAEPGAAVHLADSAVATTGQPNLALTFSIGAWL